ncbi:MAG: tetratricopeptide repeat protein [Planctomycetota bacterium]
MTDSPSDPNPRDPDPDQPHRDDTGESRHARDPESKRRSPSEDAQDPPEAMDEAEFAKAEQEVLAARAAFEQAPEQITAAKKLTTSSIELSDRLCQFGRIAEADGLLTETERRLSTVWQRASSDADDEATAALLQDVTWLAELAFRRAQTIRGLIDQSNAQQRVAPEVIPDSMPPTPDQIASCYAVGIRVLDNALRRTPDSVDLILRLTNFHGQLALALDEIGEVDAAFPHYRQALLHAERMIELAPTDSSKQSMLAHAHNAIGQHYAETDRLDDARTHHRESMRINERLSVAEPKEPYWAFCLATDHENLADLALRSHQGEQQLEHVRRCVELRRAVTLGPNPPKDWILQRFDAERALVDALQDYGLDQDAFSQLQQTVEQLRAHFEAQPRDGDLLFRLADALLTHGYALEGRNQFREALDCYQEALKLDQRLIARRPEEPRWHANAAHCHLCAAIALIRLGDQRSASRHIDRGLQTLRGQLARRPDDRALLSDLSHFHADLSSLLMRQDQLVEALEHQAQVLEIDQRLAELDPHNRETLANLALSHDTMANLCERMQRTEDARLHRRSAVRWEERLVQSDPESVEYQTRLAQALVNQASTDLDDQRLKEAEQTLKSARGLVQRLMRLVPEDHHLVALAAQVDRVSGEVSRDLGDRAGAKQSLRQARDQLRELVEHSSDPIVWYPAHAEALEALAELLLDAERPERHVREVVTDLTLAVKRRRDLATAHPGEPQPQRELAHTLETLADAQQLAGDLTAAQNARSEAARLFDQFGEEP